MAKERTYATTEDEVEEHRRLQRLLGGKRIAERRIDFALRCHKNTRGEHLNFKYRPYQVSAYADPAPDIVWRVPVQIGKTEWEVCDTLAAASLGLAVFCVQPKFELRAVHVAERYDKMILNSPEYQEYQGPKGRDSTTLKHFGRGTLRFVGSRVESDMIAFPADVLAIDELDRCDLTILELAEDRLQESDYQIMRRTSTPTIAGSSTQRNIDYFFQLSDQKHWYIPCPTCGKEQELKWDKHLVMLNRDEEGRITDASLLDPTWTEGKWERTNQRIKLPCIRCGNPLDRLAKGHWQAHRPEIKGRSGYTMSRMVAVTTQIEKLWLAFEKALGNPIAMQRIINSFFGEPYSGIGDRLSEELLEEAIHVMPPPGYVAPCAPVGITSMGIDVNRPYFDVWISDYPVVSRGRIIRRCIYAGKVLKEGDLYDLVNEYRVSLAVIDAEPEVRLSLRFQDTAPCEVWRARYEHTEGLYTKDLVPNEKTGIIACDRTNTLDALIQSFFRNNVALPNNYMELCHGKMKAELLDSVRVLEEQSGVERYIWKGSNSHALHACNYDYMAFRMGGFAPASLPTTINVAKMLGANVSGTRRLLNEYDAINESPGLSLQKLRPFSAF